jgi:hypothetical protein
VARSSDRLPIVLLFGGVVLGVLALVLPLYATPSGTYGGFLAQLEGAPLRVRIGFALPSVGLLVLAFAAGGAIAARASRRVAAGVAIALGVAAALSAVSLWLRVGTGSGGREGALIVLTAAQSLCYLTSGLVVAGSERPA